MPDANEGWRKAEKKRLREARIQGERNAKVQQNLGKNEAWMQKEPKGGRAKPIPRRRGAKAAGKVLKGIFGNKSNGRS